MASAIVEVPRAAPGEGREEDLLHEDSVLNAGGASMKFSSKMRQIPTQTTIAPSGSANTLCRGDSSNSLYQDTRTSTFESGTLFGGTMMHDQRESTFTESISCDTPPLSSPRNRTSTQTPRSLVMAAARDSSGTKPQLLKFPAGSPGEVVDGGAAATRGILAGMTLMRRPLAEEDAVAVALKKQNDVLGVYYSKKELLYSAFRSLLCYRLASLYFLGDAGAIETCANWAQQHGFEDLAGLLTEETVSFGIILELYLVLAAVGGFVHWKDCGHWLSIWVFTVYTQICGLRFYLYANPITRFLPVLIATCCIPYLPQWVQIHSEDTHATEVRVPPFPMKKRDFMGRGTTTFQTPAYLGNAFASAVTSPRLRWAITLFLYAFPVIGGVIGIYRGYALAVVSDPTTAAAGAAGAAPIPFDSAKLLSDSTAFCLIFIAISMFSLAMLADFAWYGWAIFSMHKLGQNVKSSKEVYTITNRVEPDLVSDLYSGPYEPPRLDNDTTEKLIAKAKYVKQQEREGRRKLIRVGRTIDSVSTPMAFAAVDGAGASKIIAEDSSTSSEDAARAYDGIIEVEDIFREMTVVLPAYMPNEEEIIMDVLRYYKKEEAKYPGGYKVLLVWNSPKPGDAHAAIEAELKEFEAEWPKFKSFRIQESTCKADNLNVAIRMLDTDFALFNDSDTIVSAETMCRAAMHIFGPEQYDVAQSRNIYCNDDYRGYPEGEDSFRPTTALMAFRDSFAQTNCFMGLLFARCNFNGRGGFWRTSAIKEVEFDTRTLAEDHDASCRGFMYFGHRGVLDNNMLCQEREPATLETINKQRRRWMHCALQIMDRTISWNWSSRFTKGFFERWVYWYTYTENRTPTESPIFYLFYFEVFGLCYQRVMAAAAGGQHDHQSSDYPYYLGFYYIYYVTLISLALRLLYIAQHLNHCRYNPAWFRLCIPLHMVAMLLQGGYHKLHAYHDYYWGTGKWVCTARAANTAVVPNTSCSTSGSGPKPPALPSIKTAPAALSTMALSSSLQKPLLSKEEV